MKKISSQKPRERYSFWLVKKSLLVFISLIIALSPFYNPHVKGESNSQPYLPDYSYVLEDYGNQSFYTREKTVIFDAVVVDSDGDSIACTAANRPEGATIDVASLSSAGDAPSYFECTIIWVPELTQLGDFSFDVGITDGITAPITIPVSLHVDYALNTAPTLWVNSGPYTVKEGDGIGIRFSGNEKNADDPLEIGVINPPEKSYLVDGISYSFPELSIGKYLMWKPNFDDAGNYELEFYATDGIATVTQKISVTVTESEPAEEMGAEAVLILVNQNSPDSVALGEYYKERRGVPENQILALDTTTEEMISMTDYNNQIKEPLQNYLRSNNLVNQIRYIVPTYGIPTHLFVDDYFKEYSARFKGGLIGHYGSSSKAFGVDSYLADLFGDKTSSAPNPYYKGAGNAYHDGMHFPPSHYRPDLGFYMVTRLDGPSLKIAKGLVDKALYAGKYTGPANNNNSYIIAQPYLGCPNDDAYCNGNSNAYSILSDPVTRAAYSVSKVSGAGRRPNPLWMVSNGNEYIEGLWGEWRPGAIPMHFQSFTAPFGIRNTNQNWRHATAELLAADATATFGTVTEPYAQSLPQPTLILDYFLNGDRFDENHYNFAESIYMAMEIFKWTNIIVGDPLYKLSDHPTVDDQPPKIENVSYACSDNKARIGWSNKTALDGSPDVSYGSVEYGPTKSYGSKIWDETVIEYSGIAKKNYLSEHALEINDINCSDEHYFKLSAIDPEDNLSTYSFAVNQPVRSASSTNSQSGVTSEISNPSGPLTIQNIVIPPRTNRSYTSHILSGSDVKEFLNINISNSYGLTETLTESDNSIQIESGSFILNGYAPPDSTVEIEIHSDPIKLSTKADEQGFWSIRIEEPLPSGQHKIFITIKGKSEEIIGQTTYGLAVKAPTAQTNSTSKTFSSQESISPYLYLVGLLLLCSMFTLNRSRRSLGYY